MALPSWLHWLERALPRNCHGRTCRVQPPAVRQSHQRLSLEPLEDRTLPSTFYAATVSDLIADINAANTNGKSNTIILTAPTSSPYVLSAASKPAIILLCRWVLSQFISLDSIETLYSGSSIVLSCPLASVP
jgi:hypothetical protein